MNVLVNKILELIGEADFKTKSRMLNKDIISLI